jgi:hypothetical protein
MTSCCDAVPRCALQRAGLQPLTVGLLLLEMPLAGCMGQSRLIVEGCNIDLQLPGVIPHAAR